MVRRKSNGAALRDRLRMERLVGIFVKFPALESIEILAGVGFDFAIVDLEHSQLGDEEARRLARYAFALGFPAIVRVPRVDPGQVNRLLEAGAAGIQLSTVRRAEQVRELADATRYPPSGRRSVSLAHPAAAYGSIPLDAAVTQPPPLLVGQIETTETDDPLETVLGAGLDVAFIGSTDLLVDLRFDRQAHRDRVTEIAQAARNAGVTLGQFAANPDDVLPEARYIALSTDVSLLRQAAADLLARARATAPEPPRKHGDAPSPSPPPVAAPAPPGST